MRQNKTDRTTSSLVTAPVFDSLKLERRGDVPLYRQISQGLRNAILSGALPNGTRLPTERALALQLDVNRTTIMNAYHELSSEGLIEGHVGRGTIVKRNYFGQEDDFFDQEGPSWLLGLANGEDILPGPDARLLTDVSALNGREGIISLAQSTPGPDLLPTGLVHSIISEALPSAAAKALGYCPVEGMLSLRQNIAAYMRGRGMPVDAQHILILSGSTQGIGLIARFLLKPGDEVVVEVPTYLGALQTFRALGARIIGIPTDSEGMRVDLLEGILARRQPRFIYTQPTFQNPTDAVMSPERRRRLLSLARRYQMPILEDDPYGEIYYEQAPPPPLKAQDTHGNVIYLSTFSKMLAPGLRVAWLAAPEPVIERLALHKQIFDLNTNALGQWVVSELLRRDLFAPFLVNLRRACAEKRDLTLNAIEAYWPADIHVKRPEGGFNMWCRLPGDMRARSLLREAAHEQVVFVVGEPFHADGGGQHHIRLSFTSEPQITAGIQRIGQAMKRLQQRRLSQDLQGSSHKEHLPVI